MSYLGIAPRATSFDGGRCRAQGADGRAVSRACGREVGGPGAALVRRRAGRARASTTTPGFRDALEAQSQGPGGDLWPLFDALEGVPVAVVRGANSDLLTAETVAKMRARRPDLIVAEVPDRGHVPFLDEPEALAALEALIARVDAVTGIADIRAAAARARGVRRTPLLGAPGLDRIAGRRVLVKAECLQVTGSFKARGAWAALSALAPEARGTGVLAYSSGNHAQGIAWAAAAHGVAGGDPDAVRRAGDEDRRHAGSRRRGRALRPGDRRTGTRSAPSWRRRGG